MPRERPTVSRPAALADPAAVAARLDEAASHFAEGRLDAAARIYREVERGAPQDIRATYSLAVIDVRQGRLPRARRGFEAVVARWPGHVAALHNLGAVRQQLGDWPGAAEAYAAALQQAPQAAETRTALAVALTILGRGGEAVEHYRVLAQARGTRGAALTRIALIDPAAIDDADLADMREAASASGVDEATRIGLWFAVGEVLQRRGDLAAFAAFAEGNRRQRATVDAAAAAEAHSAAVRQVRAQFPAEAFASPRRAGARTAAPIFIVGFPRSGSTLIEQILGAHVGVQALGETAVLPGLLEQGDLRLTGSGLRSLADGYLAALRSRGWDGVSQPVDKTLENYLHVGLIQLMFPRAVILHSVRDPMDTGYACFRQLFARGNETLYDLADIGAEYRRYREVMDHWANVLPGRVVDVGYEALVADSETAARRLLAAAGLAWDPGVLRFFERERAVATASAGQVRRPIYASSVGRWRAHAAELAPLRAALGLEGSGASDGT